MARKLTSTPASNATATPTMRSPSRRSIIGSEQDGPQPPNPIDEVAFRVRVKSAHRVLNFRIV